MFIEKASVILHFYVQQEAFYCSFKNKICTILSLFSLKYNKAYIFYVIEKKEECEMTIDKEIGFERLEGGEIVREWKGNKL